MPRYFNNINTEYPSWKFDNNFQGKDEKNPCFINFINDLKNKKGCKEAQVWYDSFNEIVKSIKFSKIVGNTIGTKYYTPTITTLRFRESPELSGKYIRTLNKSEKLELLETGKEATIDNIKGNWVKVRTEKGEEGWCFSGYLEEVKP
jgi:hypothetical protein